MLSIYSIIHALMATNNEEEDDDDNAVWLDNISEWINGLA